MKVNLFLTGRWEGAGAALADPAGLKDMTGPAMLTGPEALADLAELDGLEPLLGELLKAYPQTMELGILPIGRRKLSGQLVVQVAALLDHHPADLHIFCGTPLGKALGVRVAARTGRRCYTKGEGFLFEQETQTLRLRQKVYSSHGTGLFTVAVAPAVYDAPAAFDVQVVSDAPAAHDVSAVSDAGSKGGCRGIIVISAAGRRKDRQGFAGPGETGFGTAGKPAIDPAASAVYANADTAKGMIKRVDLIEKPGWDRDLQEDEDTGLLELSRVEREDDLASARLVFVGGKGLGSRENYLKLKKLATAFGAACGCSRPAAMSGWDSYDRVVGVSGVCLEADVCVTFGVSGAGPMMYGLEHAGRLIAINTDRDAPIFRYADEGILEDCGKIIAALDV